MVTVPASWPCGALSGWGLGSPILFSAPTARACDAATLSSSWRVRYELIAAVVSALITTLTVAISNTTAVATRAVSEVGSNRRTVMHLRMRADPWRFLHPSWVLAVNARSEKFVSRLFQLGQLVVGPPFGYRLSAAEGRLVVEVEAQVEDAADDGEVGDGGCVRGGDRAEGRVAGLEGAPLWCGRDSGEVCGAVAGGSEVEVEEKQSLVGAEHVVEGHVTMADAGGVAGVLREVVPYRGRQCPEQVSLRG